MYLERNTVSPYRRLHRQVNRKGKLLTVRVKDAGESKRQAVMVWIGTLPRTKVSPLPAGLSGRKNLENL